MAPSSRSSNESAAPLYLELGRSRLLALYLILIHLLAMGSALALPLPLLYRALLAGAVALHGAWLWWGRGPSVIRSAGVGLAVVGPADWRLREGGAWRAATPAAEGFVSRGFMVLVLRLEDGGQRRLLILPDMLDRESFSRLRAARRVAGAPLAPAAASAGERRQAGWRGWLQRR